MKPFSTAMDHEKKSLLERIVVLMRRTSSEWNMRASRELGAAGKGNKAQFAMTVEESAKVRTDRASERPTIRATRELSRPQKDPFPSFRVPSCSSSVEQVCHRKLLSSR